MNEHALESIKLKWLILSLILSVIYGCSSGSGGDSAAAVASVENSGQVSSQVELTDANDTDNTDVDITSIKIAPDFELINKFDLNLMISNPMADERAYFNLCHPKQNDQFAIDYSSCVYRGGIPSGGITETLTLTHLSANLIAEIRLYKADTESLTKVWTFDPDLVSQSLSLP